MKQGGTRTICATIHSPTSYAFGLFDELVLLKAGQAGILPLTTISTLT